MPSWPLNAGKTETTLWKRFWSKFRHRPQESPSLDPEFQRQLPNLERILNYHFRNPFLLQKALTHASYPNRGKRDYSYERLEFLGDAVLQLIISQYLFENHPHGDEGLLTRYRTILVNGSFLAECAEALNLMPFLRIETGFRNRTPREQRPILADIVEALLGALYLDGGLEPARKFVQRWILARKPNYPAELQDFNHKGILAERCQSLKLGTPVYEITGTSGPDHSRTFVVQVRVNGKVVGFGEGHSKKEASQNAAEDALKNWELFFPG